jgi:hypothetical protein
MPLPDATPDKRIYELLKTVDLENLTFADLQAVGQTIFAEQGAEDELRRLILLNLARLSVVGEWTGLTSAGGVSVYGVPAIERFTSSEGDCNIQLPSQSYGGDGDESGLLYGMLCYPWQATNDGAVDAVQIYCPNAIGLTSKIGVYSTSTKGLPETLLLSCEFDHSATGVLTQTSLTGSLTLEKGTNYWMAIIPGATSQQFGTVQFNDAAIPSPIPVTAVYGGTTVDNQLFDSTLGGGSLPATIGTTELARMRSQNRDITHIGLRQS